GSRPLLPAPLPRVRRAVRAAAPAGTRPRARGAAGLGSVAGGDRRLRAGRRPLRPARL
ncbi:MAG: hypothetical protein AVDCRST_MAG30-2329, partial [uncultured Solirubrobacteraceae bacterium]